MSELIQSRDACGKTAAVFDRPEIELLRLLARRDLDEERFGKSVELSRIINWDNFFEVASDQRLLPLVAHHLRSFDIPDIVRHRAEEAARDSACQAMLLSDNLVRISSALQRGGIRAVAFKGPVLALEVFGSDQLRQMADLDLLVAPSDLDRSRDVLLDLGFEPKYPITSAQFSEFVRNECEYVMRSRDNTTEVELHWRLAPAIYGLDVRVPDMISRARISRFFDRDILILAPEDNLVALCVHARKHVYRALGWVADIAEIIRKYSDIDWSVVREVADSANAWRTVSIGCYLAANVLDEPIPDTIMAAIASDAEVPRLSTRVVQEFIPDPRSEFDSRHYSFHLQACSGAAEKIRYLWRVASTPTMSERMRPGKHSTARDTVARLTNVARAILRSPVLS